MRLELVLQELGHYLVNHHGFAASRYLGSQHISRTTRPAVTFYHWLTHTPECREYFRLHSPRLPRLISDLIDQLRQIGYTDEELVGGSAAPGHSTAPIVVFLAWLGCSEEARNLLRAELV